MSSPIWKPIKGYEGLYEVSNTGDIRSYQRKKESPILLIGGNDQCGYKQVCLRKNGKAKTIRVHRLVAEAFLPNPQGFKEINHKDENKHNNSVENLEWCDRKYNVNYGTRTKKTMKPVILSMDGTELEFNSLTEAANFIKPNANICNISNCCKGLRNTAYGYKWKFKEV